MFTSDLGPDLWIAAVALTAALAVAVVACVGRSPSRPLRRSFAGGAALTTAAFVAGTVVGADLELRTTLGLSSTSFLGSQALAWVTAGVLAIVGVVALRYGSTPEWKTSRRISGTDFVKLVAASVVVIAVVLFALPVWDVHPGWFGPHGHTYAGRGFHFH